ncbi:MAG: glycosyltransferase family 39 protein [Deltaproteobacteria bacterium]|nr:glycosyltransferase family 39 protein [Deltaproteobacteria bacterium]
MEGATSGPRLVTALVVFGATAILLGAGLGRSGIWDPWEIDAADAGRTIALEGVGSIDPGSTDREIRTASRAPWLRSALIAFGFRLGGTSEWSGRAGLALAGALAVLALYLCVSRLADERMGIWAALCLATSPLFYLNASLMMGDAVGIASICAVWSLLALAIWGELGLVPRLCAWLLGFAALVPALFASGALVGVAMPLFALVLVAALRGDLRPAPAAPERLPVLVLIAIVAGSIAAVGVWMTTAAGLEALARALGEDGSPLAKPGETFSYMLMTGGVTKTGALRTFDSLIEQVAHGMFPWSVVLPLALVGLFVAGNGAEPRSAREAPLRLLAIAGLALSYGVQAYLAGRVGPRAFAATPLVAVALASWIRQLERSDAPRRFEAFVACVVGAVLLRDFLLYPDSPLRSLDLGEMKFPASYRVGRFYAPAISVFALGTWYVLSQGAGDAPRARFVELWAGLRRRVRDELAWRTAAFVLAAVWIYLGVSAIVILSGWPIAPWSMMTRLAQRAHLALFPLPLAAALAIVAYQAGWEGVRFLSSRRPMLLGALALVIACWGSWGFLPRLGQEFSARQVFDTYERLRRPGETLGEFHTGSRSAAYYSEGGVNDLSTAAAVATFLATEERRFVVFPESELAAVTSAVRAKTRQHVRILDDRSSRLLLGSNLVRSGERDTNPLRAFVLSREPSIRHRVFASFERKIDYLGYDLGRAGRDETLGAGEELTITYYFRCNQRPPGYKMFVHIDGQGARLNGDHDPVDGKYPLRYWAQGDYIVDRQTLRVPAHFRPGDYTIFLGFFEGDRRLSVVEGPADDVNRVKGGTLVVR